MPKSKSEKRLERQLRKSKKSKSDAFAKEQVALESSQDSDDFVIFSLKDLTDKYHIKTTKCNDNIRSQLLLKLHTTCCSTWNELILKGKCNGGLEKLPRSVFKVPLPECVTDDINSLYALRFNAQSCRLIGYRSGNIFHAIFADVDLSTYNHN